MQLAISDYSDPSFVTRTPCTKDISNVAFVFGGNIEALGAPPDVRVV
jgi:hypothetical protein